MSLVDTDLRSAERNAFLEEIRSHLPAFLSSAATERVDPVGDVTELLNLRREDLRRVVAAHFALSDPVRAFVAALPNGLRHPVSSSERPRIMTQAVRGPIDWPSTFRARATAGSSEAVHVIRPAQRVFNTPENRALVWLLDRLDSELGRTVSAEFDPAAGVYDGNWFAEIAGNRARIRAARRHAWLRGIKPVRPDGRGLKRLRAARTAFYKKCIPAVIDLLARLTDGEPNPQDLVDLLCQRYFEPARNWKLFELVVALRISRAVAEKATEKRKARPFVGAGRSPYARYALEDGTEVSLWYQTWPDDITDSLHGDARGRYRINADPARPDIVIERRRDDETIDCILLELKASRKGGTLGGGLLQMLGYLKDRPERFTRRPYGWLVPLPSGAFESRSPEGRELWAVDSDLVADACVERMTSSA